MSRCLWFVPAEVTAGQRSPMTRARAIYRYVLSALAYDKTKPG